MAVYCFTFGQLHYHPETKELMRDYWIEIEAPSLEKARRKMFEIFKDKWGHCYYEKNFMKYHKMFPKGCHSRYEVD